uniref:Uncharacterized protein n=1 Tax=Candidatus Kentrum sp. TC TaxID=2126339 RepID=A0A450YXM5_9GAMM|nr:MAG: hypothetical protein BECKTC1821E_GA0114239_10621 [Candidatus Kentron sp. TC]
MKKYNAKDSKASSDTKIETAEVAPVLGLEDQIEYGAYIGLDVHKDTIATPLCQDSCPVD